MCCMLVYDCYTLMAHSHNECSINLNKPVVLSIRRKKIALHLLHYTTMEGNITFYFPPFTILNISPLKMFADNVLSLFIIHRLQRPYSFSNRSNNHIMYTTLIPERNLPFCRMNIDINAGRLHFNEKKGYRMSVFVDGVSICLVKGMSQCSISYRPTINKEDLMCAVCHGYLW